MSKKQSTKTFHQFWLLKNEHEEIYDTTDGMSVTQMQIQILGGSFHELVKFDEL